MLGRAGILWTCLNQVIKGEGKHFTPNPPNGPIGQNTQHRALQKRSRSGNRAQRGTCGPFPVLGCRAAGSLDQAALSPCGGGGTPAGLALSPSPPASPEGSQWPPVVPRKTRSRSHDSASQGPFRSRGSGRLCSSPWWASPLVLGTAMSPGPGPLRLCCPPPGFLSQTCPPGASSCHSATVSGRPAPSTPCDARPRSSPASLCPGLPRPVESLAAIWSPSSSP